MILSTKLATLKLPKLPSDKCNIWSAEDCPPVDLQYPNIAGCSVTQGFAEFVPHKFYAAPQRRLFPDWSREKESAFRMTKILLPGETVIPVM